MLIYGSIFLFIKHIFILIIILLSRFILSFSSRSSLEQRISDGIS